MHYWAGNHCDYLGLGQAEYSLENFIKHVPWIISTKGDSTEIFTYLLPSSIGWGLLLEGLTPSNIWNVFTGKFSGLVQCWRKPRVKIKRHTEACVWARMLALHQLQQTYNSSQQVWPTFFYLNCPAATRTKILHPYLLLSLHKCNYTLCNKYILHYIINMF